MSPFLAIITMKRYTQKKNHFIIFVFFLIFHDSENNRASAAPPQYKMLNTIVLQYALYIEVKKQEKRTIIIPKIQLVFFIPIFILFLSILILNPLLAC